MITYKDLLTDIINYAKQYDVEIIDILKYVNNKLSSIKPKINFIEANSKEVYEYASELELYETLLDNEYCLIIDTICEISDFNKIPENLKEDIFTEATRLSIDFYDCADCIYYGFYYNYLKQEVIKLREQIKNPI